MSEIKAKLVAATEDGVDKTKIQDEITQLQAQLKSISSICFVQRSRTGLQANVGATMSVVSSFVRDLSDGVIDQPTRATDHHGRTICCSSDDRHQRHSRHHTARRSRRPVDLELLDHLDVDQG